MDEMMDKVEYIVDRTIDESIRDEMVETIEDLLTKLPAGSLVETLKQVKEALSANDWAKWGVITALLWSHLNQINSYLARGVQGQEAVRRELANIARKMDAVVARVR